VKASFTGPPEFFSEKDHIEDNCRTNAIVVQYHLLEIGIMAVALEKVVDEALLLPADDRVGLVEKIIESLNLPTRSEIDKLWAEEAEKRIEEIDSGNVALIDGETVFETIRRKYAR
jgi:putative addiction module component (TIGR02574 family)